MLEMLRRYFAIKNEMRQKIGPEWDECDDALADHWMLIGGPMLIGGASDPDTIVFCDAPFSQKVIEDGSQIYSGDFMKIKRLPDVVLVVYDNQSGHGDTCVALDPRKECVDPTLRALYEKNW